MCSCERGEVFTFEDLVFTITEKTAPNIFPEILIPPRAASSQGPNHWGDAGSGDGNDDERGMAAVLSSDLTQCLGVPPWGVLLWQLTRGLENRAVTSLGRGHVPRAAPRAFISTEATTVTVVAKRINIFAKYQLSSS